MKQCEVLSLFCYFKVRIIVNIYCQLKTPKRLGKNICGCAGENSSTEINLEAKSYPECRQQLPIG